MQEYRKTSDNPQMEYKDRIRAARKHARLTQSQLAGLVGINQASISDLEHGRSQRSSYTASIARECGVSPIWLETGVGTMLQSDDTTGLDANVAPALAPSRYFEYPEISWVQAGAASEAIDFLNIRACPNHTSDVWAGENGFWLKVVGSSMTSPSGISFPEGFLILVAPDIEPHSGQFVVARMVGTNEATFKQLVRDAGEFFLKPLNPAYSMRPMDEAWELVGTVVDGKMPKSAFL